MEQINLITVFDSFSNTTRPKYYSIDTVLGQIKNCVLKDKLDAIRTETDEKKRKDLKKKLPCILFSGTFKTRHDNALIKHSGFVVLDWDKQADLNEKKKEICKHNFIYSCFVSPSGDGLKAVVKIPAINEKHRGYYRGLMKVFPDLDATSINESRICYASADSKIYINKNAVEFTDCVELEKLSNTLIGGKIATVNNYSRAEVALKIIRDSVDGEKHACLLKASKLMGGYISGGIISEDEGIRLLESEISLKNIDDFDEAKRTIRKGVDFGKNEPIELEQKITMVQSAKIAVVPKVEIEQVNYLADEAEIESYLEQWRAGTFQKGLSTGIPSFDNYFLFKRGNFNVINGFDNVGKSTGLWYLCFLSAFFHNWRWVIYSNENKSGTVKKILIEFYWGVKINRQTVEQYEKAKSFVSEHFIFVNNDFMLNYKNVLQIADLELQKYKIDGMLIDPYNSLSFDYSKLKHISTHEYHYAAASEMQIYSKKNDLCLYLNCHVVTSALRADVAPRKADTEGGGKFSNKADDFMTFHREVHNREERRKMQIYVRKIKEIETGGGYTDSDTPYILNFNQNNCGYTDSLGFDPIATHWKNSGKQIELIESNKPLPSNTSFDQETVFWRKEIETDIAPF